MVCAMRLSIHAFKHKYLCDQVADHNQILSEASFGWGRAALVFCAYRIRTLVSMATDTAYRVVVGENCVIGISQIFCINAFSYLKVMMTCIRA